MRTFACLGHVEAEASDWEMAVLDLLLHVRGYFFADLRGWTFGEKVLHCECAGVHRLM